LIKLFALDSDATKIARIVGISRNAAERWINRFRVRIQELSERERLHDATWVQMDETYFTKSLEYFPKHALPDPEIAVFGMIDYTGKVYAKIVPKANKTHILPIVQSCCAPGATIYTDGGGIYKGLAKLGYKHSFVNHANDEFSRYENGGLHHYKQDRGLLGLAEAQALKV